jgi:predicted RNA methylase
LLAEQDTDSPHKYLNGNFSFEDNSVALDIGAAEGIFSLMVIENARKMYIVEPDSFWVEALEATFKEWKFKTTIIKKSASSQNDDNNIALDEFFFNEELNFIKIDAEGAEIEILLGAERILKQQNQIKNRGCRLPLAK